MTQRGAAARHRRGTLLSCIATVLSFSALPLLQAGSLLKVDFGQTQTPTPTETGFDAFQVTNLSISGPVTRSFANNLTVRVTQGYSVDSAGALNGTGTVNARNRSNPSADAGDFTNAQLYSDFVTAYTAMGVQVSGLLGDTDYLVTFYVYDNSYSFTQAVTDITGATTANANGRNVTLGSVMWSSGAAFDAGTPNERYSLSAIATTDATGRLTFKLTNSNVSLAGLAVENAPMLGVYKGSWGQVSTVGNTGTFSGFDYFSDWLGRANGTAIIYYNPFTDTTGSTASSLCTSYAGSPYRPTWSAQMLPGDKSGGNFVYTLADAAVDGGARFGGAYPTYASYFTTLAQRLVAGGQGNAIIRLGWEMNGNWYAWRVLGATDAANYKACWIKAVNAMRAVSGAAFKFDFCPSLGYGSNGYNASNAYPGDAYVDIIGIDHYNTTYTSGVTTPDAAWADYNNSTNGLAFWAGFATSHGKALSLAEWGTGPDPTAGGFVLGSSPAYVGNDDPTFVRNVHDWIQTHNVVYHNYWDYSNNDGYNGQLSNGQYPLAGAQFRDLFGAALWLEKDLGTVAVAGNSWFQPSTGVTTVMGSGTGVGGSSDSAHFTYTSKFADCSVTARITGVQNTSPNAVAGLAMREGLGGDARNVFFGVTASGDARLTYRSTVGATTTTVATASGWTLPRWVRIKRAGDVFTAYTSVDGSTWTSFGSVTVAMNKPVQVGGVVSGITNTALNSSTFASLGDTFEVVMDTEDGVAGGVTIVPAAPSTAWTVLNDNGTMQHGSNYLRGSSAASYVRFTPNLPEAGQYAVFVWINNHGNSSASNVPLTIAHAGGTASLTLNEKYGGADWRAVAVYSFNGGSNPAEYVQFNRAGADNYVVVDAIRFVKIDP